MLCTLLALALSAPQERPIERAAAEARRCLDATVASDFETVADLTYPKVIEQFGGRREMLQKVREVSEAMKQEGFQVLSGVVDPPKQLVESDGKLYGVAGTAIVLKTPDTTLRARSFLIGISADDGRTWTFIDGAPGKQRVREAFPEIPAALTLPDPQPPEVVPNPE